VTDHFQACARCGQTVITRGDVPMCGVCADRARAPQGETVRLFEPAPAQLPGQLNLSGRRERFNLAGSFNARHGLAHQPGDDFYGLS
jgi:hypothetical protein